MKKKKPSLKIGSRRIKSSNKKLYKKNKLFWKYCGDLSEDKKSIIELYIKNNNSHLIADSFEEKFLKGYLSEKNQVSGERIKRLPDGKELARAGFSLLAKDLKINLNHSENEWDVMYENSSGLKTYLYSIDKVHLEQKKKKEIVEKFEKNYKTILEKLETDIKNNANIEYLALYFLLKTYIRIGNEDYYNKSGHKGLTTLEKKDIQIDKSHNTISLEFIGKDGVPQKIIKKFPYYIISLLENHLNKLENEDDFVFVEINNLPIHSSSLSKILYEYTGEHFYPHIIRSHFADMECLNFLKENKHRKSVSKEEVENKINFIAQELGHKKFNKKTNEWEISPKITIESYIYPEYLDKMRKLYEKDD
ncbi:MAG: hypothetical protein KC550_04030 [Nanoarchaeota archaeon]|nr:hypothetical protein [Nanoarchaeota archaeon]